MVYNFTVGGRSQKTPHLTANLEDSLLLGYGVVGRGTPGFLVLFMGSALSFVMSLKCSLSAYPSVTEVSDASLSGWEEYTEIEALLQ